ncbi:hypothetical protein KAR91_81605 [Candidatus Pacearchaeota archaeon]|nr:hypothetical protein [Candidatus Pacearchaeota archaeon]
MTLSKERIKELERKEAKLNALEAGGVDNWKWYGEALKEYNNTIRLEKKLEEILEDIEVALLEGAYEPSERGAGYSTTEESRDNAMIVLKDGITDIQRDWKLPKED